MYNDYKSNTVNKHTTVRLIRHATVLVSIEGKNFLIDPMLSSKAVLDPIPWTNEVRNPTVDMPISSFEMQNIIQHCDYIIITHLHPDHWDAEAQKRIPKEKQLICQPEDVAILREQGFRQLLTEKKVQLPGGLVIERVEAQHGHGGLAEKMSPASGYVIKVSEKTVYITGDTVWCSGVENILDEHKPDVCIVNAGSAQFQFGEPITMTIEEVIRFVKHSKPSAKTVVVHLEAINHCYMKRADLKKMILEQQLSAVCFVPDDGAQMML